MSTRIKKTGEIYCIGIKGVGMTMLAQFLAARGASVSGSDITDTFLTDKVLRDARIKVLSPFSPENIPAAADLIIHSSAFTSKDNSELAFIAAHPARFKKTRLLNYAAALGEIFNQHRGIAVCGSHGKTTTSAWLGYVLWRAGKKPNVMVGSRVPQFQGSSLNGKSKIFVAEVDEYQNKFQYFQPAGIVLNNIDYDHPDFFKTPAAYEAAFAAFVGKLPAKGFLVINNRDAASGRMKKRCRGRVLSYDLMTGEAKGETESQTDSDYLASGLRQSAGYQIFNVSYRGQDLGQFRILLWGEHNVLNALAVIAAARELGVPLSSVRRHLAGFRGTERRAQILGKYRGALIIDDYAHHPTEIKATLAGLRARYPKKNIITVFHPHTFTRTKALFKDFSASFADTDELVILDIYSSAREFAGQRQGGVSSRGLVAAIDKRNKRVGRKQAVKNISSIPLAAAYLKKHIGTDDILLLMGAGDVFRVGQKLLAANK
jgi:UDP-N-acetylmuramate--alanine ligase